MWKDLHFIRVIFTFIIFLVYSFSWPLDNFWMRKASQFWLENFQAVFKPEVMFSWRGNFLGGTDFSCIPHVYTVAGSHPARVLLSHGFPLARKANRAESNLYQRHDQCRWKRTRCIQKLNCNKAEASRQLPLPFPPRETVCITIKWLFFYLPLQPHVYKAFNCSALKLFFFPPRRI